MNQVELLRVRVMAEADRAYLEKIAKQRARDVDRAVREAKATGRQRQAR